MSGVFKITLIKNTVSLQCKLPNELWLEILGELGLFSIAQISRTNQFFKNATDSEILWKKICKKSGISCEDDGWKRTYKKQLLKSKLDKLKFAYQLRENSFAKSYRIFIYREIIPPSENEQEFIKEIKKNFDIIGLIKQESLFIFTSLEVAKISIARQDGHLIQGVFEVNSSSIDPGIFSAMLIQKIQFNESLHLPEFIFDADNKKTLIAWLKNSRLERYHVMDKGCFTSYQDCYEATEINNSVEKISTPSI